MDSLQFMACKLVGCLVAIIFSLLILKISGHISLRGHVPHIRRLQNFPNFSWLKTSHTREMTNFSIMVALR